MKIENEVKKSTKSVAIFKAADITFEIMSAYSSIILIKSKYTNMHDFTTAF